MKRYCISPLIGDGSDESPFRPSAGDVAGVSIASIIPTWPPGHAQQGQPKYGFALCIVGAINWAPVLAVSNLYAFPDHPLDSRMDAMESEARVGMEQSVEAYNLDGAGFHFDAAHADGDSYRSLILSLAQQLEPAISNLNSFDVSEPIQ